MQDVITSSPLVSIVMPAYNVEKYIADAINSVLNQSYNNFELIIVNDGSTDGTSEIIESLAQKDKRIKVLSQKNQRQGPARNNGFKLCKGDYVYFADSDDILHPDLLKIAIHISCENATDMLKLGFLRFNSSLPIYPRYNVDIKPIKCSPRKMLALDAGSLTVMPWLYFYSVRFLKKIGLNYPSILCGEDDVETYRHLCYVDKIMAVTQPLYFYRQRKTNITNKPLDERYDSIFKMLESRIALAKECPTFSHELYWKLYKSLIRQRNELASIKESWVSNALVKCNALLAQISDGLEDNPYFIMEEKMRNEYESSRSWKLITKLKKVYHALHLDALNKIRKGQ